MVCYELFVSVNFHVRFSDHDCPVTTESKTVDKEEGEGSCIGVVPSCLMSVTGMNKAKQYGLLGCMGQTEEVGFGLLNWHIKGMLLAELLAVFLNSEKWLT